MIDEGLDQARVELWVEVKRLETPSLLPVWLMLSISGMLGAGMLSGVALDSFALAMGSGLLCAASMGLWFPRGPSVERRIEDRSVVILVGSEGIHFKGSPAEFVLLEDGFMLNGSTHTFARRPEPLRRQLLQDLIRPRERGTVGDVPVPLREARKARD